MNTLTIFLLKLVRLFWWRVGNQDRANACTDEITRLRDAAWGMQPLGVVRRVGIIATPHTLFVAHLLAHALRCLGVDAGISTAPPGRHTGIDLYFVICPQMFRQLPLGRCVVFQMEQSINPRWFTRRYFRILKGALAVLDYSQRNLAFLEERGVTYRKVFHAPIGALPDYDRFLECAGEPPGPIEPPCEVLFYGDANCERRQRLLAAIRSRFRLRVLNEVFGAELHRHIRSARVVVNLHYYEGALLETTRIYECLSLGASVVSETSADMDEYAGLRGLVEFADAGREAEVLAAIERVLARPPQPPRQQELAASHDRFHFMFCRMMLGLGLIGYDEFCAAAGEAPVRLAKSVCISLPETAQRRALARDAGSAALFDGLRAATSWVGCGMSYKYLCQNAIEQGMTRLEIREDDVTLPPDFKRRMAAVQAYLGTRDGSWDIFSGLIAHLHPDTEVLTVETHGSETFVTVNRMTSTVLNIYSARALRLVSAWDCEDHSASTNTIDRYLERQPGLRVVTTVPFLVGHRDDVQSSLWQFGNVQYRSLILQSEALLRAKVARFLSRRLPSG